VAEKIQDLLHGSALPGGLFRLSDHLETDSLLRRQKERKHFLWVAESVYLQS
jgi:hypothetical protein